MQLLALVLVLPNFAPVHGQRFAGVVSRLTVQVRGFDCSSATMLQGQFDLSLATLTAHVRMTTQLHQPVLDLVHILVVQLTDIVQT